MTGLLIYLVGCILSYGKILAVFYEEEENSEDNDYPPQNWWETPIYAIVVIAMTLCSWLGLICVGIAAFQSNLKKYWFKWSFKELHDKYLDSHEDKNKDEGTGGTGSN